IATASWYYLSGLDVRSSGSAGTLVAFGDSITDGVQSTVGGNDRWPNDLARRLDTVAGPTLSVADGGIGGNRVLTASRCCGASAEARFAGDAIREAVNTWIRTSGAFDGVIDFDAVMRDPANPLRLNPAYDSGDHLHPNDAGYQAMADAINLDMLLPRPR